MEELYVEGVAPHDGPDHAPTAARASAKRWPGVRAGRAIEPRNQWFRGADAVVRPEGNTADDVTSEPSADPARSKNLRMHGISMRENREIPSSPARRIIGRAAQGRPRPQV
jgi:hypothetical protein